MKLNLSLFADDMSVYVENPKGSTKQDKQTKNTENLPEGISEFCKVKGCKRYIQNPNSVSIY